MSKRQPTEKVKAPESHPAAAGHSRASDARPQSAQVQLDAFEAGMRLFHERKLEEARKLFHEAAKGPERDVANRARTNIAMCDSRLVQPAPELHSAEDYYNYGVALINTGNVGEARAHLEKALQLAPDTDHIHYALALALALSGDPAKAYENLKRAIELEPHNRVIARQDADFAPLASQPPFDALLYPEKKSW